MNKPWSDSPYFENLISGGKTLLDKDRLWTIYSFAASVCQLPGSVAEFGVYKGGCLKMLSQIFTTEDILAYDTFEGIPFSSEQDNYHKPGDFRDTDLESVSAFVNAPNVVYKKGLFSEFLRYDDSRQFKLVHVDCDVYNSVIEACLYFTPRMVKGGVLIFDDYGAPTCLGAKLAVDNFYGPRAVKLTTGQALYIA